MKTNEWLGTNFITSARIEKYQEIFKHKHQIYSKIENNISIKSYSPKKTRITFEEAMKGEVRKKIISNSLSIQNHQLVILLVLLFRHIGSNLNFKFLLNGKIKKFIYCGIQKLKLWFGIKMDYLYKVYLD